MRSSFFPESESLAVRGCMIEHRLYHFACVTSKFEDLSPRDYFWLYIYDRAAGRKFIGTKDDERIVLLPVNRVGPPPIRSPCIYGQASACSSPIFGTRPCSSCTIEPAGRKLPLQWMSALCSCTLNIVFLCGLSIQSSTYYLRKPQLNSTLDHYTAKTNSNFK